MAGCEPILVLLLVRSSVVVELELPIFVDGLDRPIEFLPEGLGEQPLDGHAKLLREDDGQTRIDVVLKKGVSP